jgi:hypothetical protein
MHPVRTLLALGTETSMVKVYDIETSAVTDAVQCAKEREPHCRARLQFIDALPVVGAALSVEFSPCGHFLAVAASSRVPPPRPAWSRPASLDRPTGLQEQSSYVISIYTVSPPPEKPRLMALTDDSLIPGSRGPRRQA